MSDKNNWGLAIAALTSLATLGAWLFPDGIRSISSVQENATVQEPIVTKRIAPAEPEAKHHIPLPEIPAQEHESLPKPSPPASSGDGDAKRTPDLKIQSFTLIDHEQRIIVPGCASLAVEFQEVAGVDFVTVRINVGEKSTNHAVSHAGEQFRFTCGGDDYQISILLVDRAAGMVQARIEQIAP